ncbi:MAG: gas vesicle protein V [Roseibium sp.]|uniref:gas vesicle protein V n=1 Tax=Roseibium sp. TaxID=1936156 RepID=UPI002616C7FF|nr:gas vesicle protein V [Roseibium sp.]MCV0428860.1 gas vesicle protein V [Roseibium sp.]
MSRLTSPDSVLSETRALRDRREHLLREADRHRYRLHRLRDLQTELQQVTTDLLKREREDSQKPKPKPEPLGDAGAVGGNVHRSFPYKD